MKIIKRNPCKECLYYHKTNNTCQSKKCATGGAGYVTWWDRLWCEPYKREWQRERRAEQSQINTIENTNDKQSEEAIKEIVKDYITATYGSIDNL